MNKKIISRILLGSTLTFSTCMIVVSCGVEEWKKDEKLKKEINDVADSITLDYPEMLNLVSNKIDTKKLEISNYDKEKYEIKIKDVSFDSNNKIISVTFFAKDKKVGLISDEVTKHIDGFGFEKISIELLNSEINKVIVSHPNKEDTLSSDVFKKDLIFSGFDSDKFKILITNIKENDKEKSAAISFKLVNKNDETNQSDEKEITINGFKKPAFTSEKLIELAKNIKLEYPDKENVYPWETKLENFLVTNIPLGTTISDLKITGLNPNNLNAIVTFILSDKDFSLSHIEHSLELSGFKVLPKDYSNLTKTLLNDEKGFINLDFEAEKTLSLYKELAKNNAEVTFNFNTSKVIIPKHETIINFLKPETCIEVGTLTDVYKRVHEKLKLEVTSLINEEVKKSTFDIFGFISEILSLSKQDALMLLKSKKDELILAADALKPDIGFLRHIYKNIEKIIESDNYSIIYNQKTGYFSIQSGRNQIDFNNIRIYAEFFKLRSVLKEKIVSKIKEVLLSEGVEDSIMDLFLNDMNSNSWYVIHRYKETITTWWTLKQIKT